MNDTTWEISIERLPIKLAVGVHEWERERQDVLVSLTLKGTARAEPSDLTECIDYEPIIRWLKHEWPNTKHTPLLETRINQLLRFAFLRDGRISEVRGGLYKVSMAQGGVAVGMERYAKRADILQYTDGSPTPRKCPE